MAADAFQGRLPRCARHLLVPRLLRLPSSLRRRAPGLSVCRRCGCLLPCADAPVASPAHRAAGRSSLHSPVPAVALLLAEATKHAPRPPNNQDVQRRSPSPRAKTMHPTRLHAPPAGLHHGPLPHLPARHNHRSRQSPLQVKQIMVRSLQHIPGSPGGLAGNHTVYGSWLAVCSRARTCVIVPIVKVCALLRPSCLFLPFL